MSDFMHDIAFGWRNALRRPATALLIIATLALGIGANTAMFSVAYHVLLAPLPYAESDRLVRLTQVGDNGEFPWSSVTFADFEAQNTVFEDIAFYEINSFTMLGRGVPEQVSAGEVSGNLFPLLGISPVLGRTFTSDDEQEGATPTMMLSYDFWLTKFNADPAVVNTDLELNGVIVTVIGVLPRFIDYPHANDIWVTPAGNPYNVKLGGFSTDTRTSRSFRHVFARLNPGVSIDTAMRDAATIAQRLRASYPDDYPEDYAINVTAVRDELVGESANTFILLLALAFLIVLIASANVANLNLANVSVRSQELAVREAIGANPGRIRRQLLTESLMLALAGGVLGLIVAYFCMLLFADFAAIYTPLASEIRMDAQVLTFTVGLSVVTGILSGISAIFTQRDLNKALKEGSDKMTSSADSTRKRQGLLVVQFALAFVMLTTSMLILLSLHRLNVQDTGFVADEVLAVSLAYHVNMDDPPEQFRVQIRNFGNQLLDEVQAIPGVTSAALLGGRALLQESYYSPPTERFNVENWNDPDVQVTGHVAVTSESYFAVMDIPLIEGRLFTRDDVENSPGVVLVNERLADRYFPGGDAIGQRIKLPWQEWSTIVGVVANVRSRGLNQIEDEMVYYNFQQFPGDVMNLYVRSSADLRVLGNSIADIIHTIDPRQSVGSVTPLEDIRSAWLAPATLRALLTSAFGVIALVITLSGVIGVLTYNINRRIHEIGIHMAIGASPANIRRMFMVQVLQVYLLGLASGLVVMLFAAPMLEPLLYQTAATAPAVYLASLMLLTVAVLSAMYLPTRKASNLHPATALHMQ